MHPEHAPQGDELPPGATLCGGQYTVDSYLNAGGFGVTYLARDSLGRRVVIKECFPSAMCFRSNQSVCVRSHGNAIEFGAILDLFEKEAHALASLQHPFIVGVHQYFRDNGTAYMAMDFVEGRTLLDLIETTPEHLTPSRVRTLLSQLLKALAYIHRNDILHRDISPDNILIDDGGLPVLIDFGAAREDATRVSRVLSKLQTVKDGYSPQEFYVAGSAQTYASDLYALAATFYHVVTGTAPPSSQARMAAAARNEPDPLPAQRRISGYDAPFLDAIWSCLSLFPKDRLPDAATWLATIDETVRHEQLQRTAEHDRRLDAEVSHLVRDFFQDFTPKKPEPSKPARKPEAPPSVHIVARKIPLELEEPEDLPPPDLHPVFPRKPRLQPIEKMKLKYQRPPAPIEPPAEPQAKRRPTWLERMSRPFTAARKPVSDIDPEEEIA